MTIQQNETQLTGQWLEREGRIVADATCDRINELVSLHLRLVGSGAGGWEMLYRDPGDGRLWELTFPQSWLQGGGPPQLRCITQEQAGKKYSKNSKNEDATLF